MAVRATKEIWAQRVLAWRQSNLSPRDFARGKGFHHATLRWWGSRLAPSPAPRFLTVVTSSAPPKSASLVVEVGQARIQVDQGFDPALLAAVVKAIGGPA